MYVETDPRYTSPDGMATETVVSQFMGWLVRMMKPERVLETGCYIGSTTVEIGQALKENGSGTLFTCDTKFEYCDAVYEMTKDLPVVVESISGVEQAKKWDKIDLAFLDSGGDRVEEAKALRMNPNGIVVLHDAHRPTFEQIAELGWQRIKFYTPRGLGIFQIQ